MWVTLLSAVSEITCLHFLQRHQCLIVAVLGPWSIESESPQCADSAESHPYHLNAANEKADLQISSLKVGYVPKADLDQVSLDSRERPQTAALRQ